MIHLQTQHLRTGVMLLLGYPLALLQQADHGYALELQEYDFHYHYIAQDFLGLIQHTYYQHQSHHQPVQYDHL